jgi:hypothetical protein
MIRASNKQPYVQYRYTPRTQLDCICWPSFSSTLCNLVRITGRLSHLFPLWDEHFFQVVSFLILCFNFGDDRAQILHILQYCQITTADRTDAQVGQYLVRFRLLLWWK